MSKKLCTSSIRKQNRSTPYPIDLASTSKSIENDPSFWLARLPNEVILKIFSFLSPRELLLLRELKYERFTDLTFMIRAANFYLNRRCLPADMSSFFCISKLPHLREINFNYVKHVKPSVLEKCILKCPHLTNLFVIQCGLSNGNISRILSKCEEIENFAWDPNGFAEPTSFPATKKLKKVYFTNDTDRCHDLEVMLDMFKLLPSAEDIRINFSSHCLFHLHPVVGKLDIFSVKGLAEDKSVIIYFDTFREQPHRDIKCVCRKILHKIDVAQTGVTLLESIKYLYEDHMYIHQPPWLQLRNMDCDISKFLHIPDSSVEYLTFVLQSDDSLMSEDTVENIQRVGGAKLKYFTMREIPHVTFTSDLRLGNVLRASDALPEILKVCTNIVALNLSEVHIVGSFPFEAFYCLKSLEILSLSSCAIKVLPTKDTAFKDMVQRCTTVKHFSLYGCTCKVGPPDIKLTGIQKWTKLQHLLLCKVAEFRTLPFLMKVANYCKELRSLEIIDVGNPSVCHYTPSVAYLLKNSKSLTFLRINQQCFYPMCQLFWKAVGEAKKLEGLCISTRSRSSMQSRAVLNAVSQLRHLHLFHIFVVGRSECLLAQVRQIMTRNGVEKPSLLPDFNITCPLHKCPKQHVPPF